ncbi:MAG: hypothetical protein ACK4FB_10165 [Brevundimonas sp.]|uniref:hypothetical protein n=1 Tax=Brevundimonas sp. TaxID=1871086 RepID=UPI003919EB39
MRRFLVWSALALVIGLGLAGGGYWAYWNFYARFQPVVIQRDQAEIQRLLDEASWISAGGGGEPLYMVAWRDSAAAQRYEREEFPKLRAAGVEARVIVFARPDREGLAQSTAAERATVAEIWLSRDWSLYERWTATPARNWTAAGIPGADGNLARGAVVQAGRDFVDRLNGLLRGQGVGAGYPLILWRDREGYLKACACSDPRSWAFIRDDLDAPDQTSASAPGRGPATEDDFGAEPLPYPELGDLPRIPPSTEPSTNSAVDAPPRGDVGEETATPRPAPARPTTPREAPRAQKQEDATFF